MPLDHRIISGMAQPVQTAEQNYDLMVKVQKDRADQEDRARKQQLQAEADQERAAMQQILKEAKGDLSEGTLRRVMQIAPKAGLDLQKSVYENREHMYKAVEQQSKAEKEELQQGLSWLGAARKNPSIYPNVYRAAMAKGGELAAMIKDRTDYDPAFIDGIMQAGRTAKEQIEANEKILDALRKGDYGSAAEFMRLVLPTMDPEDARELADGVLFAGMPSQLVDAVMSNPAAFTLKPNERATLAGQAEGRQIQREGQAITVRGQDMSAETARRGQDMTAETARQNRLATGGPGGEDRTRLADAVMVNPELYDTLTPTAKTALIPDLASRGFKFGGASNVTPGVKAAVNRLNASILQLETLEKDLTQKSGIVGRAQGLGQTLMGKAGIDERAAIYDGISDTLLPGLARASGEVGNLAEQEQSRYQALAPRVRDPLNVRLAKLAAVKLLVQAAAGGASAEEMSVLLDYGRLTKNVIDPKDSSTQAPPQAPPPGARNATPIGGTPGFEIYVPSKNKTYFFDTQEQLDEFKRKAGIP